MFPNKKPKLLDITNKSHSRPNKPTTKGVILPTTREYAIPLSDEQIIKDCLEESSEMEWLISDIE